MSDVNQTLYNEYNKFRNISLLKLHLYQSIETIDFTHLNTCCRLEYIQNNM